MYYFPYTQSIQWDPTERVLYRNDIFHWCLRNAQRCVNSRDTEKALHWDHLAAQIASLHCEPLVSWELESHLLKIAAELPIPPITSRQPAEGKRYLHVVTCALPYGGHTAMMRRWVQLDPEQNRHSVVTLEQTTPVPASLARAIKKTGGEILQMNQAASLLDRARALRELAWQDCDVLVLHIHPQDVVATVALGIPGGPRVLFINHGAHKFWVGGVISDLVLNCRGSALENKWTEYYRGISRDRICFLPIPLLKPKGLKQTDAEETKSAARAALNVPADAIMVLTVGDTYKFTPVPGISFIEAASQLLTRHENAYVIAVGVEEDIAWKLASQAVGGRLKAVGRQSSVEKFHQACDIYIEGFPFGSTTAFLEAGLAGIPCVLAPGICPPPYTSDGLALDGLKRPKDLEEYLSSIEKLMEDKAERARMGAELAEAIKGYHSETGWASHLTEVKKKIPASHRIYPVLPLEPVPKEAADFWARFWSGLHRRDEFIDLYQLALARGLRPRLDLPMVSALTRSTAFIRRNTIFNLLLRIVALIFRLFPAVARSRFWCHNLFFYLRDEGFVLRLLYNIRLRLQATRPEEPAK